MKNKMYDEIIEQLKKTEPKSANSREITESIIRNIETIPQKRQRFITIRVNEKQWTMFSGARAVLTTAAVFLIAFLIFQQIEINSKLDRLESDIVTSKDVLNIGISRDARIKEIFNEQFISNAVLENDFKKSDFIFVNQKSINYMYETIRLLEKENNSYRELFEKYTKDSTHQFNYK